jgi:hypothetical protein
VIDDDLVLRVERLRDSLEDFKGELRKKYRKKSGKVGATAVRTKAAQLAERWLVEVAARDDVRIALTDEVLADLNIEFQRLLTYSERTSSREKYDQALAAILKDFRANVVVALKQNRGATESSITLEPLISTVRSINTAFVGQSFAEDDAHVNELVKRFLQAFGLTVVTGEKPEAERISSKVRARIETADLFVGVFTQRDKLVDGSEWATSAWIIDEKAYALAKNKRLILIKEQGVKSVGGLQGDYEYLEFRRDALDDLLVRLLETLTSLLGSSGIT